MEFHEKLQTLRKSRNLTQEELAESLFVSRTAISKWESGRGYPNVDSIKDIACFFSVTIDELLSSEKILSLAKKENQTNIKKMCNLLFGVVDVFTLMPIILPLYPNTVNGHIYSVNLLDYTETSSTNLMIYWIMFITLIIAGALKIALTQANIQKGQKVITWSSIGLGVIVVLFLSLTRQVYATIVMFSLLVIKGFLHFKHTKT